MCSISLLHDPTSLFIPPLFCRYGANLDVSFFLCCFCSGVKSYGNMYYNGGCSTMPIHEGNLCSAQSMYAHRYWPICQARRANYLMACNIFFKPCISSCNIKTYVVQAAQMVSMSMNALEHFGRGCCIRAPQGYQHAAPLLVCHSSSSAGAGTEPVGSDAFSQLGRLMKVI